METASRFRFRRDAARVPVLDLHEQLAAAFPGGQLDLVLLHDADPLFRWAILERATLLYGDVDAFLPLTSTST